MKLWDAVFTCYLLLDQVLTSPVPRGLAQPLPVEPPRYDSKRQSDTSSLQTQSWLGQSSSSHGKSLFIIAEDGMALQAPQEHEDLLQVIRSALGRLKRSSEQGDEPGTEARRQPRRRRPQAAAGRGRGAGGRGRGGGSSSSQPGKSQPGKSQGCKLRQIQLNVSDLGLGYQTKEEMIFKYCSGPCTNSETNYDKILNNLAQNKKLLQHSPPHACCRPIAFDDDLSFLDDNLIYHTMKKHSARRCGCV